MANLPVKSAVDVRIATDEHIFKRLNKKINGLNRSIESTPTIQNQGDLIKPDGTIAKTNDDIRLIEGIPRRTPTGLLEYHEETPKENFPVKVRLETIKYETDSFMDAVDVDFGHFLQGYDHNTILPTPNITVSSGPVIANPQIEVIDLNETVDDDSDEEEVKTASEEHGEEPKLLTEINAAGDLSGVGGIIWMVWKGVRYRFYNGISTNTITDNAVMTTSGHSVVNQDKAIIGLTNTKDGRNLEVFMVDRDMNYNNVDIVPSAEINEIKTISSLVNSDVGEEIEWGSQQKDGFIYNTNSIEYNGTEYEPGDIIQPAYLNNVEIDIEFLPDIRHRWTEYHPSDTNKPALKPQIYTPTGTEVLTKEWEGKLIRGYLNGDHIGFFMVVRGEMMKCGNDSFRNYTLKHNLPFLETEDGNNWSGYHDNSYTVMDWNNLSQLGYPSTMKAFKDRIDHDDQIITLAQHHNGKGWNVKLRPGKYVAKGTIIVPPGYTEVRQWPNNDASYIKVPEGMKATVYDLVNKDDSDFDAKTYIGPKTKNFSGKKNDDISRIVVSLHNNGELGISTGGGWMGTPMYKEYIGEGDYYNKPHLAPYNKLFDRGFGG